MTFRLKALSDLAIWAMIGLLVVAVLLGRGTAGPEVKSLSHVRHPAHPRYQAFSGFLFSGDRPHATRLLDTETGRVTMLDVTGDEGFDAVSCSPWHDERGQYHLAGRRRAPRSSELGGYDGGSLGAVRCTFPGGEVVDRIAFDLILGSPPCWSLDQSDRIVFAGCDGRLYDFTLPGAEGPRNPATTLQPRRIRWRTAGPAKGVFHIQDPCWPSDQALGGRLVVSLSLRKDSAQSFEGPQLWWVQLNEAGTAVVAAGRLIAHTRDAASAGVTWGNERCPSVSLTHDGVLMLAYVSIPDGPRLGGLWIAPITFKSRGTNLVPRVEAGAVRRLAASCLPAAPAFSADGRWIYAAVQDGARGEVRLKRFAINPDDPRQSLTGQPLTLPRSG
jgi:hypothetical protein